MEGTSSFETSIPVFQYIRRHVVTSLINMSVVGLGTLKFFYVMSLTPYTYLFSFIHIRKSKEYKTETGSALHLVQTVF
jgi:hypothetical protein